MTTIPHSVIVKCYCRDGSAADIAAYLNRYYGTGYMTEALLRRQWAEELERNVVLRELGERPTRGFPPSTKTKVAEDLLS